MKSIHLKQWFFITSGLGYCNALILAFASPPQVLKWFKMLLPVWTGALRGIITHYLFYLHLNVCLALTSLSELLYPYSPGLWSCFIVCLVLLPLLFYVPLHLHSTLCWLRLFQIGQRATKKLATQCTEKKELYYRQRTGKYSNWEESSGVNSWVKGWGLNTGGKIGGCHGCIGRSWSWRSKYSNPNSHFL